jgi:hypothetical protein
MGRLTIHLPHRQSEAVKDLSCQTGESVEALVAEAVDALVVARRDREADKREERRRVAFEGWGKGTR